MKIRELLNLKRFLRSLAPNTYTHLWELKRHIQSRILTREPWAHYYDHSTFIRPARWLSDIKLPAYIDTVIDIGCGNGHNFPPFEGKKLIGVDIVPEKRIDWIKKPDIYIQSTLENFCRTFSLDLSNALIFTSGTMMYVSARNQRKFLEACQKAGCRNFILNEYPPTSRKHSYEHFKLPWDYFTVHEAVGEAPYQFIHLEEK